MSALLDLTGLPGEELLTTGLADAAAGAKTIPSCLVCMAAPRLVRHGFLDKGWTPPVAEPERALYALLCAEGGDAFGRYNSLLRRWVSFQRALDHRAVPLQHDH